MLMSLMVGREVGVVNGLSLRRAERFKRVKSLQLCKDRYMEQCFSSGINSLDLERQESRYLISSSAEAKIAIFDTRSADIVEKRPTCKCIATIDRSSGDAHKFSIESVQWYPRDNGMFVSSSFDRTVKVWDSNTLQVAGDFVFNHHIYCHHMSSIAKKHCLVAVACDASNIHLSDLKSGASVHSLKGHRGRVLAVQWSPRSDYILASGGQDNRVLIWDVRKASSCMMSMDQYNGEEASLVSSTITAHNGQVNSLEFTSDGLHLLSFGTDHRLRLWNLWASRNTLVNYGRIDNFGKKHVQMAVSNGLKEDIVFVPSVQIFAFEIHSGKKIDLLGAHFGAATCCVYHSCFQELYSGGLDSNLLSWSPFGYSKFARAELAEGDEGNGILEEAYQDAWSSDES